MARARFSHSFDALKAIASDALAHAGEKGASACEAEASDGYGQTVTVRRGEVETIEYNRDKSLSVTVYLGKRKGYASTADFAPRAIRDTVEAALAIARFTATDECAGLPDPEELAREPKELDLFHPWELPVERAIEIAKSCEAAAFALDKRIVNSEGAGVSSQQWHFALANSHGFMEGFPTSRHVLSCAVIAAEDGLMQRDDWYVSQRSPRDLPKPEAVGDYAGRRALARLASRKIRMGTTGSAGGNQNLILEGGGLDLPGLIGKMDRGLLVTELMGHGINPVTGDYSRGAAGYWVERGEIRHPVEEITIAGNLRDMFRSIAAIGSDALTRGSRTCGSILVEEMTIAGN